jgi:hypothetical protein
MPKRIVTVVEGLNSSYIKGNCIILTTLSMSVMYEYPQRFDQKFDFSIVHVYDIENQKTMQLAKLTDP